HAVRSIVAFSVKLIRSYATAMNGGVRSSDVRDVLSGTRHPTQRQHTASGIAARDRMRRGTARVLPVSADHRDGAPAPAVVRRRRRRVDLATTRSTGSWYAGSGDADCLAGAHP